MKQDEITLFDLPNSEKKTILYSNFPPYHKDYQPVEMTIELFQENERIIWGNKIVTQDKRIEEKFRTVGKIDDPELQKYLKNPPKIVICQMSKKAGKGAFAGEFIPKGTRLGPYPGELNLVENMEKIKDNSSEYVLAMAANGFELSHVNKKRLFMIDAKKIRNEISYFQHLAQNLKTACEIMTKMDVGSLPENTEVATENVEFVTEFNDGCPKQWAIAARDIFKGEILGFSYQNTNSLHFKVFSKYGEDLEFYNLRLTLKALADNNVDMQTKFQFVLIGLRRTHESLLKHLSTTDKKFIKTAIVSFPAYYYHQRAEAVNNSALASLHLLSEYNEDYDRTDRKLMLSQAAAKNDLFTVLHLLFEEVDINSISQNVSATLPPSGKTPLHFALQNGHYEVAKLLIYKGANLQIADATNVTPEQLIIKNKKFKDLLNLSLQKNELFPSKLTPSK